MKLKSDHIFYTSGLDIETIISPLKKANITYFAYIKSYHDKSRICLTNKTEDLHTYLERRHYKQGNVEANPRKYEQGAILWSTQPHQELYQFSRANFDIDHGITLISPNKEYCEFFAFASTSEHPEVQNFYLNNMDLLLRFTQYYKEKAACLISKAETSKISYPHQNTVAPTDWYKFNNSHFQFLDEVKLLELKIPARQLECAKHLVDGRTSKQIAVIMKLSVRTVEYYIDLLRSKLKCRTKVELALKLARILPINSN